MGSSWQSKKGTQSACPYLDHAPLPMEPKTTASQGPASVASDDQPHRESLVWSCQAGDCNCGREPSYYVPATASGVMT